jgi:hypothetical protein
MVDAPLPERLIRWKSQFVFLSYMFLKSIDLCILWTRMSPKLCGRIRGSVFRHVCASSGTKGKTHFPLSLRLVGACETLLSNGICPEPYGSVPKGAEDMSFISAAMITSL